MPSEGLLGAMSTAMPTQGRLQVVHYEGEVGAGPDQLQQRALRLVEHLLVTVRIVPVVRCPDVQGLNVGHAGQRRGDGKAEVVVAHDL